MDPGATADAIPNPVSTSAEAQPEGPFGLEKGRGRGKQLPVKLPLVSENRPGGLFRSVCVLLRLYLSVRMLSEFIY